MKRYSLMFSVLVLVLGLLVATNSQAVLFRVGPSNVPSPPGNGFPLWYQDNNGLALDLCLPNAAELAAGICLITPDILPNPTQPISFPTNFPDEAFYWNATNVMDVPGGRATLVLGLEAAFGVGPVAVGDQITFARVRIVMDAPASGDYTVTHPFGVETFSNVAAGRRAIFFTSDIGIGAPGDFSGALQGAIGPFLQASLTPGGAPLPLVTIAGSPNSFLSDAASLVSVTGSPFGTDYFEICGPGLGTPANPCLRSDLFTLMGKVHTAAIGSPLTINRASYGRDAASAHVDVFATAVPGPGTPAPVLSMADAAGTGMPSVTMHGPLPPLGQYYGQSIPNDATAIPSEVIVTNTADIPPSSFVRKVVDVVTITEAAYDPDAGTLTITATSSDKTVPPALTAVGLPGSIAGSDALLSTGNAADPAEKRLLNFSVGLPLVAVPPAIVTIQSAAGGVASEAVRPSTGVPSPFATGLSVAVDDFVTATAGTSPISFNILTNDRTNLSAPITAGTFQIIASPTHGTISVTAAGAVTYTPTVSSFVGDDIFTYRVTPTSPAAPASNVATVTVTTTAPPGGAAPIAVADGPFSVRVNTALAISATTLTANDLANGGSAIDPNSIQIVSVTGGTATFAAGTVTYTAGGVAGNFAFSYTVANITGQRSAAASVSITIVPAADALTISTADFRTGTRRWDVTGTATVNGPGNIVTITLVRTGAVIGTATPAAGAWSLRVLNSNVLAVSGDQVRATSTAGGSATLAVRVRQ